MNLNVGIKDLAHGTNILSIDVPEQLRTRHKTGISWIDESLGGLGVVPGQVILLTGTSGAGKTTLLMQLADSLTASGHICLYNTGEESLYQVKMVAERLQLQHGFVCGQDIMAEDVLEHADELRDDNKDKQVFILQDSLQTLDDGFYKNGGRTGVTPLRCMEIFTDWAKRTYGIIVCVGQVSKNGDFLGKNAILHAVDVKAQLFIDRNKKSETYGERVFEVTKNRFGCSNNAYVIGIGERGLYKKEEVYFDEAMC